MQEQPKVVQPNKKGKKIGRVVLGILLVVGPILSGSWQYILDWSTGELQGFNMITILVFLLGVYLIRSGLQNIEIIEKATEESIKKSWRQFNWLFWPLLYLFATISGHIYRFAESGSITMESGLGMTSAALHDMLPILMVVLIYSKISRFLTKKKSAVIASMGLLMSFYFFSFFPDEMSYVLYSFMVGVLIFCTVWYFKSNAIKEMI